MRRARRPPRDMPRRTGDLRELRAIQRDLAGMRQRLRDRQYGGEAGGGAHTLAGVLLALAVVAVLVPAVAVVSGGAGPEVLAGGAAVAVVLGVAGVWLVRHGGEQTRTSRALAHRRRLLARNAELWASLRPEPADDLPLPPERQPVAGAHAWHARYRSGADPETALRALPPDAGALRVRFHRYGGWSFVRMVLVVLVVLTLGVLRLT